MTSAHTIDKAFRIHVMSCIEKYKRVRQTKFAKANNISVDSVYAHNQFPIWCLVKLFKSQYNIRSRLFKSLTEEQKSDWLAFYDKNKQIILMSKENHEDFHKNNSFDVKTSSWKSNNPNEQQTTTHTMHLKKPKNKLVNCDFSNVVENKDETNDDKVTVKSKTKDKSKDVSKDKPKNVINVSKDKSNDVTKNDTDKDDTNEHAKKHVKKRVRVRKNVNNTNDT